jgi:hypothetical protein
MEVGVELERMYSERTPRRRGYAGDRRGRVDREVELTQLTESIEMSRWIIVTW